ncbi:pheromone-binding protein-related protein 6-like [Contarinia nasturtii]|uniref:pheromone-binding protein-related protein 6-like n=1 Tax=Contarinia nasturtii TaxID=265458 RepID=UPI0012D4238E|nr:pheromone-binding protein-related protein 6-like [Contarinia nasturtii]
MKVFVSSLFLVILSLSELEAGELRRDDKWPPPELLVALKPVGSKCQEQTGVTNEAIKEFSDGEVHEDRALKCYMSCLFHEFNVVDDNGDPHFEKIQTHVDRFDEEIRHIANKLVAACQNPQGQDKCERAFSIHKCWKTTDPKHYFLA